MIHVYQREDSLLLLLLLLHWLHSLAKPLRYLNLTYSTRCSDLHSGLHAVDGVVVADEDGGEGDAADEL